MSYKATSFVCLLFHEYTAVKSIEMHYQACKCRNQILSKFTIVTPEANGRSFQEMNPKSAWLSPRNLHQLFHVLNCPSQIVCHPRSDITITNYTQSISTTTLEIFDVGFVLYMSNMFATCVIWLFLSIYSKKRLGFSQCFSWNLAVWGHIKHTETEWRKHVGMHWVIFGSGTALLPMRHQALIRTIDVHCVHYDQHEQFSLNIELTLNMFFKIYPESVSFKVWATL